MVSDSSLFRPITIGNMQLQHRVVMAPTSRSRSSADHVPPSIMVQHFSQRATPGGLLITDATLISPTAGGYPGSPGIYTKEQIAEWKKITDAVHAKGGFIYVQLWHIGRATLESFIGGNPTVSASAIAVSTPNFFTGDPHPVPHALTIDEIKLVQQEFVQAAKNAVEAGFDGIEIHGANGFLPDQFLNTSTNKRTDAYGGSIENRARFVLETVGVVAAAIGEERTAVRLSPWGGVNDVKDDTPYETWGYVVSELQKRHPHLAYIHMIEPRDTSKMDFGSMPDDVNTLDPFRAAWKGPFIAAGGYSTHTDLAFKTADEKGDLIAFGRTYIANPDLVERLRNGWELNHYDRATFYSGGAKGYIDYPFYGEAKKNDA